MYTHYIYNTASTLIQHTISTISIISINRIISSSSLLDIVFAVNCYWSTSVCY